MLWIKFRGTVSFEEAKWRVGRFQELGSQQELFVVADMTENSGYDVEGRRYASENIEPEWFSAIVYLGARLIHKAAAKGIALVQRLRGKPTTPVYFVASEEEARHLLARLRSTQEPPAQHP
ncbi:hypothetical protein [Archangium sp.]|uniref:hypothetical protein n=1 Tax=Archangium sp. TaxID=1872627 RepID=UPI00286AE2AC|nr:hypothetical protein [Archangium sp.]